MKRFIIVFTLILGLAACAQQPTRMTQINNDAPTVNFTIADPSGLELFVDGISYGTLAQYLAPNKAVELISGEHLVEVKRNGNTIYSEKHYFSESTHRTLELN